MTRRWKFQKLISLSIIVMDAKILLPHDMAAQDVVRL